MIIIIINPEPGIHQNRIAPVNLFSKETKQAVRAHQIDKYRDAEHWNQLYAESVNKEENTMPITDEQTWEKCVETNQDPYGKCCVDVARRVMEVLDDNNDFDPHKIICQADDDINAGGLTGFMAGCVAQMVSRCHSRGEEFRQAWNKDCQIKDEGEKANESGGVLNPAILNIGS